MDIFNFDNFYKDVKVFIDILNNIEEEYKNSSIDFAVKFLTKKYNWPVSWRPIEVLFKITDWQKEIINIKYNES